MKKDDKIAFRKERANELDRLLRILNRHGLIQDTSPLQKCISLCQGDKSNEDTWGYSTVSPLIFLVEPDEFPQNILPPGVSELAVRLNIELRGWIDGANDACLIEDPFKSLSVGFVAEAKSVADDTLLFAWHLDRHIVDVQAKSKKLKPEEPAEGAIHPFYHFQFGGHAMAVQGNAYGNAMFLSAPRIPHPPLELVLATDFLLSNFKPKGWAKVRADGEYLNLLDPIQNRLWSHYAKLVHSNWEATAAAGFTLTPTHLWPQTVRIRK